MLLDTSCCFPGWSRMRCRCFEKNVQEYPQSSNVYDSLGEAYMKVGQKDLAIQNYEKSLQLNPKNNNAVEQLKKLKGEAMAPKVVEQNGFTVAGIAVADKQCERDDRGTASSAKQWGRLMQEGLFEKIPNKADQNRSSPCIPTTRAITMGNTRSCWVRG